MDFDWYILAWLQPIVLIWDCVEETSRVVVCLIRSAMLIGFEVSPIQT